MGDQKSDEDEEAKDDKIKSAEKDDETEIEKNLNKKRKTANKWEGSI